MGTGTERDFVDEEDSNPGFLGVNDSAVALRSPRSEAAELAY